MRSRGLGPLSLRHELRRHRVADEVIEEVLAEVDASDARSAAVAILRPRVARCELPLSVRDERRLLNFLVRRGHPVSQAHDLLSATVAEIEGQGEVGGRVRAYPG